LKAAFSLLPINLKIKREDRILPWMQVNEKDRYLLFDAGSLLGSLERIYLGFFALDFELDMRGEVADASLPFLFRGGVSAADLADGPFDNPVTPFAILYYNLTGPLRKDATLLPPESTLLTGQNRLTLHCKSSSLLRVNIVIDYSSNFERKMSTVKIPSVQPFPLTHQALYYTITGIVSLSARH
jgi:hypothetical protein